ncbi:hypothetical protein ACIBCM_33005 [Streptomyces sp. NPDC051018]|uniref:hypothetical protein n=1 Tax=Streptomyces sp. NPDC051018 TaxID=3365639 RepID=UPI003789BCA8
MAAGAATAGTLAAVAVAVCTGPERGYAVPTRICGTPVAPGTLGPLLPPGGSYRESDRASRPGGPRCRLYVDDELAVYLSGDVVPAGLNPFDNPRGLVNRFENPGKPGIGIDSRLGDDGAAALIACERQGVPMRFVLHVDLSYEVPPDTGERRRRLGEFLASALVEWSTAAGCARG